MNPPKDEIDERMRTLREGVAKDMEVVRRILTRPGNQNGDKGKSPQAASKK